MEPTDTIDAEIVDEHTQLQTIEATPDVLQQMTKGEIDQQVATAHAYPRVLSRFKKRLHEYVTLDQKTADDCIYALPRGGKVIEGPSVRFAEMASQAWGNMRVAATIMDVGDTAVIVRGVAHDLESNVAVAVEVRRLVQKKKKNAHADEDDKQLAVAAATAIARRNAILAVIPKSLCAAAYDAADKASRGAGTMEVRRLGALQEYERRHKVQAGTVLAALGRDDVEDITEQDLRQLRGMLNAIKTGELSIEEAMKPKAEREAETRSRVAVSPSDIGSTIAKTKTEPASEPKAAAPKTEPTPSPTPAPESSARESADDTTDPSDKDAP